MRTDFSPKRQKGVLKITNGAITATGAKRRGAVHVTTRGEGVTYRNRLTSNRVKSTNLPVALFSTSRLLSTVLRLSEERRDNPLRFALLNLAGENARKFHRNQALFSGNSLSDCYETRNIFLSGTILLDNFRQLRAEATFTQLASRQIGIENGYRSTE